jgi:hypothetical protein
MTAPVPGAANRWALLVTIATMMSGLALNGTDDTTHTGRRFDPCKSAYVNGAR